MNFGIAMVVKSKSILVFEGNRFDTIMFSGFYTLIKNVISRVYDWVHWVYWWHIWHSGRLKSCWDMRDMRDMSEYKTGINKIFSFDS